MSLGCVHVTWVCPCHLCRPCHLGASMSLGCVHVTWVCPCHLGASVSLGCVHVTWVRPCHLGVSMSPGCVHVTWERPCHLGASMSLGSVHVTRVCPCHLGASMSLGCVHVTWVRPLLFLSVLSLLQSLPIHGCARQTNLYLVSICLPISALVFSVYFCFPRLLATLVLSGSPFSAHSVYTPCPLHSDSEKFLLITFYYISSL